MYGGIFTNRPFEFNLKCIVISLFLGISYWLSPAQSPIVLVLILVMSYLAISWYDHLYDCNPRMKSGQYNPRSIFKPQDRDPNDMKNVPPPEYTYLRLVYITHLFIIAPLVLYCAAVGYIKTKDEGFNQFMFASLLSFGVLATLYHGFRIFYPRQVTLTEPYPKQISDDQIDTYTGAPVPGIISLGRAPYINARGTSE
jgi:hypothetical protein